MNPGHGLPWSWDVDIYCVNMCTKVYNVYNYYCLKTKAGDGLSVKPSPRVCLLYHSLPPKSHLISSLTPHFQRPKFTLASRWFQTQGVKLTKNEIWIFCQVYGSDIPDVIDHSSIIQTIFSTKKHPFEHRTLIQPAREAHEPEGPARWER